MDQKKLKVRRSFIFTPGLKPDMFPKAIESGADMVCIELEDGVAPKDKDEARRKGLSLFEKPLKADSVEFVVRINCMRRLWHIIIAGIAVFCSVMPRCPRAMHLGFPIGAWGIMRVACDVDTSSSCQRDS